MNRWVEGVVRILVLLKRVTEGKALLYYSKPFDTINPETLISTFHYIGLSSQPIRMLTNRSQAVHCMGKVSSFRKLNFAVPQGYISGPLLYTFYVFNLRSVLVRYSCHFYEDDTRLYPSCVESVIAVVVEAIQFEHSSADCSLFLAKYL